MQDYGEEGGSGNNNNKEGNYDENKEKIKQAMDNGGVIKTPRRRWSRIMMRNCTGRVDIVLDTIFKYCHVETLGINTRTC